MLLVAFALIGASVAQNTCHSYKMCLNSRGAAWASVEVYNALEPLLEQHNLAGGMSSLVTVSAAEPADLPCSCSTPVAVEFSLPEGSILDTIVQTLPKLVDAICVTPLEDVECSTVVAQRRRLSQAMDMDAEQMAEMPVEVEGMTADTTAEDANAGGYYYGGYYGGNEMGGYYYGGERRSLVQEFEQFEANPLSLPSIPKPFKPAADRVSKLVDQAQQAAMSVMQQQGQQFEPSQVSVLLTVLAGAAAVALATFGSVLLVQHFMVQRNPAAAPLLGA